MRSPASIIWSTPTPFSASASRRANRSGEEKPSEKRCCTAGPRPRSERYPRALAPTGLCRSASNARAAIASTSRRLARFFSSAASSFVCRGIGTPAMPASRSTASGKLRPSVSLTKAKMSPCLPDEKSWKKPFWSLTKNEGVFSALKGERPAHSRPCLRNLTRRPTTSDTGSRARISSRKAVGNFMGLGMVSESSIAAEAAESQGLSAVVPGFREGAGRERVRGLDLFPKDRDCGFCLVALKRRTVVRMRGSTEADPLDIALFLDGLACEHLDARNLMSDRLQCALSAIDAANTRDPNDEAGEPAELVYGRRMSEALTAFAPDASELLRIAVRGQHIERWKSPRRAFPEDKAGYIAWRNAAKKRHAERLGQIMAACG